MNFNLKHQFYRFLVFETSVLQVFNFYEEIIVQFSFCVITINGRRRWFRRLFIFAFWSSFPFYYYFFYKFLYRRLNDFWYKLLRFFVLFFIIFDRNWKFFCHFLFCFDHLRNKIKAFHRFFFIIYIYIYIKLLS